jgi:hypothetical protein
VLYNSFRRNGFGRNICYVVLDFYENKGTSFHPHSWTWTNDQVRAAPQHSVSTIYVIILITFNFRFNLGTLAYGSLIIAICQIIRAIIEYVNHKLKKYDNEVTRAIMCMFRCLFWCLEKFLRFVNRNGNYIYHQENL